MVDDFKGAKPRLKAGATLKIKLVSNQGISPDLLRRAQRLMVRPAFRRATRPKVTQNLQQLKQSSGLGVSGVQ